MSNHAERVREEIMEIAEVLMREQPGATMTDVWEEALSLYRVRFETEVLPPPVERD
jgi:hypothetical protein